MTKAQLRKQLRVLRIQLKYHQIMNRVDANILRAGRRKAQAIAERMREVQRELREHGL